jgi:hypothetical protein
LKQLYDKLAITAVKIINENRDRASNFVNKLTVSFNQWTKRIARQFEIRLGGACRANSIRLPERKNGDDYSNR